MLSYEAAAQIIAALDKAGLPYMLVGSLSSMLYGVSRNTKDADFVVEFGNQRVSAVKHFLPSEFKLDPQVSFESVTGTTRYIFDVATTGFRIELFKLSTDPHDQERFRRRVHIPIPHLGCTACVPTAEDVVVTKLRWSLHANRNKDRDDIRDVITVRGDLLDWAYIHHWCDQHGTRDVLDEIRKTILGV